MINTRKLYSRSRNFNDIPDNNNYTCDEIRKWLGTEKHYSNQLKEFFFNKLNDQNCMKGSVAMFHTIQYSKMKGKGKFLTSTSKCQEIDKNVVLLLSNFSINNNYSHFLHSLLRLFCSLIDAKWIVWDENMNKFIKKENFVIWLDEALKMNSQKMNWIKLLNNQTRLLINIPDKSCITATNLLYGSGCVRLLPPG